MNPLDLYISTLDILPKLVRRLKQQNS